MRCTPALIVAAALVTAAPAAAAPKPAQLTPTFDERDPPNRADPACAVRFEIVDGRRSPEIIGVIDRRAVLAPKDFQAWMKAVLTGLTARGVTARIEPDTAAADLPSARLTLQIASVQNTVSTYSASVVLKVETAGTTSPIDRSYRGRVARTAYWAQGRDTFQSAIDGAFADALDEMAVDLKTICTT